ncbi:MAG: hypothetical protein IT201_09625 [Thermoleophilia bacterium]|nr:hypothetical protein [Thermoleophilia bacterium]
MRYAIAAVIVAAALAAAGCTGGGEPGPDAGLGEITAEPVTTGATGTAPPETAAAGTEPPGNGTGPAAADEAGEAAAAVLDDVVEAAGAGNYLVIWELLTPASQERLGPGYDTFQIGPGRELEEGLGSFAGTPYEVLVATSVADGVAVVAIAGQREAEGQSELAGYAAVLRDGGSGWKLELGGPVLLSPVVPGSGSLPAGVPAELVVGAEAPAPLEQALLWLDGKPVDAGLSGDSTAPAITGRGAEPLGPGPHVLVAFARAGADAAAGAWVIPAR